MKSLHKQKSLAIAVVATFLSFSAAAADCINGDNISGVCTVPVNVSAVTIEAWGAGGAGSARAGNGPNGNGGNGSSYCKASFIVSPGAMLSVAVGTGGVATGTSQSPNSGAGSSSSVTGPGISGLVAEGGFGGDTGRIPSGGSTVLCAAPNAIKWPGGAGGLGDSVQNGGGGGGSALADSTGGDGQSGTLPQTGSGGAGTGPGGDGGQGGFFGGPGLQIAVPGQPGGLPGGGGGGGTIQIGVGPTHGILGGDGGAGLVRMSFKFNPVLPTAPAPVPVMSELSLVGLFTFLVIFGLVQIRRRKQAES